MRLLGLPLVPVLCCEAVDIQVGRDVATIAEAIKKAGPGDTIHLEPKVYRDAAVFNAKKGQLGRPIVLDGHGATLEGADPVNPEQWREVSPGLFAADNLVQRLDDAILQRWFFRIGGKMVHMGRTSKGKSAAFKKTAELVAGEWTFERDISRETAESAQRRGTFFIRLEAGQSLEKAEVEVPVRSAGVQLSGDNAHLVVRNLTATHPYNDGFNIHGDCRDVFFENIRAIECGDDGISAHESAQYRVEGFVSIGNSTGICDTGTSETSYEWVLIRDCLGHDLFFPATGRYVVRNAVVDSSAQQALSVSKSGSGDECRVHLENVWIRRKGELIGAQIGVNAMCQAQNCTFDGLEFRGLGRQTFANCLVNGESRGGSTGAQSGVDKAKLTERFEMVGGFYLSPR